MREEVERLRERRERFRLGGGPKEIERIHSQGKLTARERLDRFFDTGTFKEFNLWAKPTLTGFEIDKREAPGDAVVIGVGKVRGRPVCAYAHDFTVLAGTQSSVQNWKVSKLMSMAVKWGIPYVGFVDSGGVRVFDSFGLDTGKGVSYDCDVWYAPTPALGVVPSITVTLGASYAGTAYSPMLADVFFMVKKPHCYMSLSSPELLKSVTYAEVTREEIGGSMLHAQVTGSCDYLGGSEDDCIEKAKELLGYLPSNCREKPPFVPTEDDPGRRDEELVDIVPSYPSSQLYDMHEIVSRIVDRGHYLELKREYATNAITCFARIGGRSVGIVANNPQSLEGAIDMSSSEKVARFVRYCDAYNVPLIFLVDTPGYLVSPEQEVRGYARHAAMATYAICEATVPKILLYLGRCYGDGFTGMGSRHMEFDLVLAWPTAQLQFASPEEAVRTIYAKELEKAANKESEERKLLEEVKVKLYDSPYRLGELLWISDIIDPRETRPYLAQALEMLERKTAPPSPQRKHGNIPL